MVPEKWAMYSNRFTSQTHEKYWEKMSTSGYKQPCLIDLFIHESLERR